MNEEVVQNSMQIILHAGDARVECQKALKCLANFELEEAKSHLKVANKKIVEAHKVQTDAISTETNGEKREYSVLFAHAQDTLMTIYSEINIAKQLVRLTEVIDMRFKTLEEKIGDEND
ncbi:PTS system cellobiose-specific transporter subunit IIA [Streptococcus merionis]|uniref:PTS system cellobiose-specific transporter subunit IIA n=2 Tax=Streptococcus merionis TaxID=400065 RepID=A0A239SRA9_9STRE|nr:PTS system cellobiose-specific transporter subunit IIA [Streptococcus merionis]